MSISVPVILGTRLEDRNKGIRAGLFEMCKKLALPENQHLRRGLFYEEMPGHYAQFISFGDMEGATPTDWYKYCEEHRYFDNPSKILQLPPAATQP